MPLFTTERKLMGCRFRLGLIDNNPNKAKDLLEKGVAEITRIEDLLSEFKDHSETYIINEQASQKAVNLSKETFSLIARSLAISKLSDGCFDISTKPLKNLYSFQNKKVKFPSEPHINHALKNVGYEKIHLNETDSSMKFLAPEMKISFAAIGKGYASDRVKQLWLSMGVTSGFVDASGDLNAFGLKENGAPYTIGIADPSDPSKSLLRIPVKNMAVATSGDYEQYFIHNGTRYSHNINPKTGLPISGIKSVTIIAPSAELADALATAVYVKGCTAGLTFVEQLPKTHCVIIDDTNQIHFSSEIEYSPNNA